METPVSPHASEQQTVEQITAGRVRIQRELAKVIVGQREVIEQMLIALFGGGHCLITGAPGLAKTLLVKSLARIFHLKFQRKWACQELGRFYSRSGNTRGLNRLYSTLASQNPKDFVSRNNFAATCLLLNLSLAKAHEIVRELYSQFPTEPVITSTYAYSLHLHRRTAEALAAMGKLKPEELLQPNIALYYACLLAASGDQVQAGKYYDAVRVAEAVRDPHRVQGNL